MSVEVTVVLVESALIYLFKRDYNLTSLVGTVYKFDMHSYGL